ncbi:MAG: hypothetical protein COV36_07340 [Alphaproteobacteria bacterium CG11_big_fil_rev_8_21_14_0_20_44_7]|nr:MAG: hypothetical protein COV36_07340 [Alphaproteobacteria bacterium CG11_big_fil_rev_8_21_14_0_20_44_7]
MKTRLLTSVAISTIILLSANHAKAEDNVLENPSDDSYTALYYYMSGEDAPLEKWAEKADEYKYADEFSRHEVKEKLMKRYAEQLSSMEGVEKLKINTKAALGEYNGEKKAFKISDMSSAHYFYGGHANNQIRIIPKNLADFEYLEIEPQDAKALTEKLDYYRDVKIELLMKIVKVGPGTRNNFGNNVIDTVIEEITITNPKSGEVIKHEIIDSGKLAENAKPIEAKPFSYSSIDVDDLKLGMAEKDINEWAKGKGYKISLVNYHNFKKAFDDGYSQKHQIAPGNTEMVVLGKGGDCKGNHPAYGGTIPEGGSCTLLHFSKGEDGMFSSEPSKLWKIEQYYDIPNNDVYFDLLEESQAKYGSPSATKEITPRGYSKKVPNLAWGSSESDKFDDYPLTLKMSGTGMGIAGIVFSDKSMKN